MEILSHDPSTGLTLFKGEPAEIAYNKQMKDQFMKLMAKRVSNAVRKSAASLHKDGFDSGYAASSSRHRSLLTASGFGISYMSVILCTSTLSKTLKRL